MPDPPPGGNYPLGPFPEPIPGMSLPPDLGGPDVYEPTARAGERPAQNLGTNYGPINTLARQIPPAPAPESRRQQSFVPGTSEHFWEEADPQTGKEIYAPKGTPTWFLQAPQGYQTIADTSSQPPGSLPLSATDPSGAQIYNQQQPAPTLPPNTAYYSPLTGQNYPMAPPAPKEDWLDAAGHALWNAGGAVGSALGSAGSAIGGAFTGAAQNYLGQEQQMLSGQMSRPELAGFAGMHMMPEMIGRAYPYRGDVPPQPNQGAPVGSPDWPQQAARGWPGAGTFSNQGRVWQSEDGLTYVKGDDGTWRNVTAGETQGGGPDLSGHSMSEMQTRLNDGRITPDQWTNEMIRRQQAGIGPDDLSGMSVKELGDAAQQGHLTPEQYEAEINRRGMVPDWYRQLNQPRVQPGSPGQENVVQFPGTHPNEMMPIGADTARPGTPGQENVTQFPSQHPMGAEGEAELRTSLGALTGKDPSQIQHPMAEAQQYLNQIWLRPDLDPTLRSMIGRWAVTHGLVVPDA